MRDDQSMKTLHPALLPALGALALALSAHAGEPPSAPRAQAQVGAPPAAAGSAPLMLAAIRSEIGDAACDGDQQCVSLAIGAKACGGPEAYLAWSAKGADRARVTALVTRHREERLREIERSGMASNCSVAVNPGAVCRPRVPDGKRVCQLGQGGQGRVD